MQATKMNNTDHHTLADIARLVDGELSGDGGKVILGPAPFEDAGPAHITFAGQARYIKKLDASSAGAVLVPMDTRLCEKASPAPATPI